MRNQTINSDGLSIVEMLVVLAIILILSAIGFRVYDQFLVSSRDQQRITQLHKFAKQLELYKNEFGEYPCGDACHSAGGNWYNIDCAGSAGSSMGNDPKEVSGFLNGGYCCGGNLTNGPSWGETAADGYPHPTSTTDDANYGLYAKGLLEAPQIVDPINGTLYFDGVPDDFSYCYASVGKGRQDYILFTNLENPKDLEASDGGLCPEKYEIKSPKYPSNGWTPGIGNFNCS